MNEWTCPVCGFEAHSEEEKKEHLKTVTDEKHREGLKEKTGDFWEEVKDKTEETVSDIKKSF